MNLEKVKESKQRLADQMEMFKEADSPSMKHYTPLKEDDLIPLQRAIRTGCAGMQRNITTHNGSPCRLFGGKTIKFLQINEAIDNGYVGQEEIFTETYDKLSAVSQGYFNDGFWLKIPDGYENKEMISILHTGDREFNARNLYSIGTNSSTKLLENYIITGNSQVSQGTVIHLGENSSLDYFLLEDEENSDLSYLERTIVMDSYSRVRIHHLSLPGKKSISRFRIIQKGEHAESYYYGATLGKEKEHQDLEVFTDHRAKHGRNETTFKGILGAESSVIFRGFIRIGENAMSTESFLVANLLLLSEKAKGNALPVLEIFNGEVKAKHGETVSNISDEQLLYLMSRGLDPRTAKKSVIEGFISPIIYPLPNKISSKYLEIVEDVVGND